MVVLCKFRTPDLGEKECFLSIGSGLELAIMVYQAPRASSTNDLIL